MSYSALACDDGNLISGDGCSASCEVENYYRCENGSILSASSCFYTGVSLKTELSSTIRSEGLNQGVFRFRLYPALLALEKVDF